MERKPPVSIWLALQRPTPLRDEASLIQTPPDAQTIHTPKAARYSDSSQGWSIDISCDSILFVIRRNASLNI
jgi:hypothetical protein